MDCSLRGVVLLGEGVGSPDKIEGIAFSSPEGIVGGPVIVQIKESLDPLEHLKIILVLGFH